LEYSKIFLGDLCTFMVVLGLRLRCVVLLICGIFFEQSFCNPLKNIRQDYRINMI